MVAINYKNLKSGDIVVCGGRGVFATITRIVTAGFKNRHNKTISVHTGILTNINGVMLVAEMQAKGLVLNSLKSYADKKAKRFILQILRNDRAVPVQRNRLNKAIALDLCAQIEYAYRGLIKFIIPKIKQKKGHDICSEYVARLTQKHLGTQWELPPEQISPYFVQRMGKHLFLTPIKWC